MACLLENGWKLTFFFWGGKDPGRLVMSFFFILKRIYLVVCKID